MSTHKAGLLTGCEGAGTAQFGQTCTIMHNSPKPAKSCTILKDLLEYLNKTAFLLVAEILMNFSGYLPFKTNEKSLTFLDQSARVNIITTRCLS